MLTAPLFRAAGPGHVALETTLLLHGVPKKEAAPLAAQLGAIVRAAGARPALIGIVAGRPVVGLTDPELAELLAAEAVSKVNTANIGLALHRRAHAATTVSTTMELAAAAGIRVFATGGIGGVHRGLASRLDISADLAAFTRFPVAVVTSGVKSLLDVESTREALETLGIPVVGYRTNAFPAFYLRESDARVDERFDDCDDLADFLADELTRTGRGVVVAQPVPAAEEIPPALWREWLDKALTGIGDATGRDVTPRVLARLHEVSEGRTLRANLALVRENARLAAQLAARMAAAQR
ncbi:MAG: pseudouridine-5'-phosphate glycosidase [Phycisphaerales bacterium]|nr:pseudouridine-5'-phosphate glycosidase [Phycisphaerales bacterium]